MIDPKSDPSVSKVVQQITLLDRSSTMEQSYTQASWRNIGNPSLWIDTHLLEMKSQDYYGFKRWPSAKSNPRCAYPGNKDLDYPQKSLLRVVAT
jgi:hypothetical protein